MGVGSDGKVVLVAREALHEALGRPDFSPRVQVVLLVSQPGWVSSGPEPALVLCEPQSLGLS